MKTRLNNKGYSLVELMLTLFIFGIVMIGIGLIMRTTTVSYRNGNAEVTMQTEAQIIANQVEELLVDATAVSNKVTLDANRYYYAITSNGEVHNVMFNGTDNRMYYQKGTVDDNPDVWMLMADYVSSFSILGLTSDTSSADCDNMVTVKIDMDKSGYNYSTVKEVYFRNDLENKSVQLIGGAAPAPTDPDDEFTGTIVVDRYQIIDLEKEYNIDVDTIQVSTNFGTDYRFLDATYKTSGNQYANQVFEAGITTSVDDANNPKPQPFISTSATRNSSFDTAVDDDGSYWISGKTFDNKSVKYKLSTPKVSYKIDGTSGSGALLLSQNDNDDGRDNWVEVEGINFCHMVDYPVGGIAMKLDYKITIYDDSLGTVACHYDSEDERGFKYGPNSNMVEMAKIKTASLTSASTVDTMEIISTPAKCKIGLRIDPMTGDLSIIQANDPIGNFVVLRDGQPGGKFNVSDTGNLRMACSISVSTATGSSVGTPTVIDLAIVTQGNSSTFTNYAGGSTYSATTSLWD
ncbi:MAG: prepilin-type N-terminal cleavage/methylation domain-containing protein [Lachnospiraceae bacterium]|nr:prepilin-type N-terminal cleavage/methylation domain-containing protein [Lachnospiraceae bacterium]